MRQSRRLSLIEATTNAILGIVISWAFTFWGLPLLGIYTTPSEAGIITLCYFFLSTCRAYILRRAFTYY